MSPEPVKVHIDGASRGNPGPSSFAFVIAPNGQPSIEEYGKLSDCTNNVAEYTALLRALEKAASLSLDRLHIHSDSELLVKQMNGVYRVKNPEIKELYDQAQDQLRSFRSVDITHVRRELNKRADELCNIALDGDKSLRDGAKRPKKEPKKGTAHTKSDSAAVRDDCIACLQAAKNAWSAHSAHAPSAEQVWDQLWSVLEDGGVLKKKKTKDNG